MGWDRSYGTAAERGALTREFNKRAKQQKEQKEQEPMDLAGKITTVVIDKIKRDIIRPGPVPEERECYDMAKELDDIRPQLIDHINLVLKVERDMIGRKG